MRAQFHPKKSKTKKSPQVWFPVSVRRLCVNTAWRGLTSPQWLAQSFLDPYFYCGCPFCSYLLPTHPPISLDFFYHPENWFWSSWTAPTSAFRENDSRSSCEYYIQFRWMVFANSIELNPPHYPVLIFVPFLPARCFIVVLSSWGWHIPTKGLGMQSYFCLTAAVKLSNAWLCHPETPTWSKCDFGSHCLQLVPNCSWC